MKKELDEALVRDFPLCFSDRHAGMRTTLMCWGFECGDGWEPSIRKTAAKLESLIKAAIEKDPEGYEVGYYRTSQIKEKFGRGCWYLSGSTDEMYDLVRAWEKETATVCEQCGQPGELRGRDWLYTACVEHAKPEDLDGLEVVEKAYIESEKENDNEETKKDPV
jgi:hypothetical protein